MRYQRLVQSTPELDLEENNWWNNNALTIESVWAHTKDWQDVIRNHYLNKAKKFFSYSDKPINILELGCGSGWVGRQIADRNCNIIGTDFSEEQITLAKNLARKYRVDNYCSYELADSTNFGKNFDGVLIHAFLHHLSEEELATFFFHITQLPKGTKFFIYEPVFVKPAKSNFLKKFISKSFSFSIRLFLSGVNKYIKVGNALNGNLNSKVVNIFNESKEKEWFLSPKEVPFYEDDLTQFFEKYFVIKDSFWVNSTDFNIAQTSMLHNKMAPNKFDKFLIVPLAVLLDRIYLNRFCKYVASKHEYHFKCFQMIIK